ncbi:MAG: DUF2075 domain-containing protein [Lactobacillus sp.]
MIIHSPIIEHYPFNPTGYEMLCDLNSKKQLDFKNQKQLEEKAKLLCHYPTVYVIEHSPSQHISDQRSIYVGETNNIVHRTRQHLYDDPKTRSDWQQLVAANDTTLYVIGHEHFNKSMTLDIENQFMLYLSAVTNVKMNNRRGNPQDQYFPSEEVDQIFSKIWYKLQLENANLFPAMALIKDMAIFKASPFHKLTSEQADAKEKILARIQTAMKSHQSGQLILVTGEAGAGKTVLLSSLFYDLETNSAPEDAVTPNLSDVNSRLKVALLVNHEEQLKVYQSICQRLDLNITDVSRPTGFINNHLNNHEQFDVVLVDEAHLLWTQGHYSYHKGHNQIDDLLQIAKVVVAVFDPHQILHTTQVVEPHLLKKWEQLTGPDNLISLHNQLRIDAALSTIQWIHDIIDDQHHTIGKLAIDPNYDIQVFDTPGELQRAIQIKNKVDKAHDFSNGISRILATYDWAYKTTKPQQDDYWYVAEGDWKMPWNYQLKAKTRRMGQQKLAWAEEAQTINEVGSTFTIQGFDLNYAGVIIGPSVKYRGGHIVFDPNEHADKAAIQNRTLSDGSKKSFANTLINNELNVLLTRGVHGLYLHAVDPQLQAALKWAVNHKFHLPN